MSEFKLLGQILVLGCFIAICWCICAPIDAVERRRRLTKAPPDRWLDDEAFLAAIRAVESGGNPRAVGPHGELSAYQFTKSTWALHTQAPHTWAQSPVMAEKIARAHLAYLQRTVIEAQRLPDVLTLALAWHHGPNFEAAQGLLDDYQRRVLALYNEERAKP